jgi:hypothetical protein
MKDDGKYTYVKVENANIAKLSIRKLSMLYTGCANMLITINELRKRKQELRQKVNADIEEIEKNFRKLYDSLPQEAHREIEEHMKRIALTPHERKIEAETGLETFESLKSEFENIKQQLEAIK